MHWPVIQLASSLRRNPTIAPTSAGAPMREIGMRRLYSSIAASLDVSVTASSVSTMPGITAFTRIEYSPSSSAAQRVSMLTPALETQYADIHLCVSTPAIELTLTML